MKQFSKVVRIIIGVAGFLLACSAVGLTVETYLYLLQQEIAPDERSFQKHRMYCQMILVTVGAALIILAAPIPKGHTYRLGWPFTWGIIFLLLFLKSLHQFIGKLPLNTLSLMEDTSTEMGATIFFLILALVCFKWQPKQSLT